MNRCRIFSLFCSATLFLTGLVRADNGASASTAAPSVIGEDIFGPALAPPLHREQALTPQEQALLAEYDKNGDGRLDEAELEAAHGAAQQRKEGRDAIGRRIYDLLLEKFDSAKAGKLNPAEQKQAMEFLKTARPRIYAAFLKQFDRNGDGELNEAETGAAFQYLGNLPSGLGKFAPKDGAADDAMKDGMMGTSAPSIAAQKAPASGEAQGSK